jgi:hypothetical protein
MQTFQNMDAAKEFLIDRILAEARREGIQLSKVEREILAYSADEEPRYSAFNQTFEQECNEVEYEEKVANLIRNLLHREDEDLAAWDLATDLLVNGDHYLLVMIEMARTTRPKASARPPHDRLKLIATAGAIVTLLMILIVLFAR